MLNFKPVINWAHNHMYKTIGNHIVKAIELLTNSPIPTTQGLVMKSPTHINNTSKTKRIVLGAM